MRHPIPRCQIVPLPDRQAAFQIDGLERLRWHFDESYPRPFFYPMLGPSGQALTRMGHPGDFSHEHHRSVWFAHHDVAGSDFWSDRTKARVRQKQWLAYQDGPHEAVMAVVLGWRDGDGKLVMEQELVASVSESRDDLEVQRGETLLELQATFRPAADELQLGKTNFGFLAVRVAKSISAHFGGGQITNSNGQQGEPDIFGKPAQWMDYSGPVPNATAANTPVEASLQWVRQNAQDGRPAHVEGITYFDHPTNPRHPAKWHVRSDGWMGASVCLDDALIVKRDEPLTLRYLLHAHQGALDAKSAAALCAAFAHTPGYEVVKSTERHLGYKIRRRT